MPTRAAAIAVLAITVTVSRPAAAQQSAADSVIAPPVPTVNAARPASVPTAAARSAEGRDRLPAVFYGGLAGAAAVAFALHVDPDTGGYHDGWTTATSFPDKAVHALAAWAITNVGIDLGARPRHAAVAVCAAGTAFEFAQGYVSPYDVAADCAGAASAAVWQSWRARRRARAAARTAARKAAAERSADSAAEPPATSPPPAQHH